MAAIDDLRAQVALIQTGVANVAQDITVIKNNLPAAGGLTAEEVETLRVDLTNAVASIQALDAEN